MSRTQPSSPLALAAGSLALCAAASAQTVAYDVTILGEVPGAYITYGRSLNDHGEVVGAALFIPGGLKAWTWTASQGYVLLPQPPTIGSYAAVDINNAGVIAGDGGGDSGEVWRYTAGVYEMLGVLPDAGIPRTSEINAAGSIAGSCYGSSFYYPRHSVLAEVGKPLVSALDNSEAFGINDPGQLTGVQGNVAYRLTPGVGLFFLPPLGAKNITSGAAINDAGSVVGTARSTAEHSNVPFLFTDAGGMQEVGDFGGRAFGADLNELNEVVGSWEPFSGVRKPWVWSQALGTRFLNDSIDPALQLKLENAFAINAAGQILCDGYDAQFNYVPVLLTPATVCQPDLGFGGPGTAVLSVCGDALAGGRSAELRIDSDVPGAPVVLGWGLAANPLPFAGGTLVPVPVSGTLQATTDASGDVFVPALPGGGGPVTVFLQAVVFDAAQPGGLQITNALELHFLP